ncbi:MAG: type 1 glutamine amidotransferase domain-containing protein [Acidimicrobiia bacterium]
MATTEHPAPRDLPLSAVRVAFLVANEGIEERELTEPWEAVTRAGARAELLAPDAGEVQCFRHLDRSITRPVDRAVSDASPDDYDALVLPGGVANADQLRTDPHAVHFVRQMFEAQRPTAVICHGPWILADAGVLGGRTLTSWPSLRTDLHNAGAEWVDEEVRVDGRLVSSRNPHDLPAFCRTLIEVFAGATAHH